MYMYIGVTILCMYWCEHFSLQFMGNASKRPRLKTAIDEANSRQYLLQRISVAIQRGNTAPLLGTMGQQERLFDSTFNLYLFINITCVLSICIVLFLFANQKTQQCYNLILFSNMKFNEI